MLITVWQEKFLQLITEEGCSVFPSAMVKALLAEEADYMKWTEMAEKFFSRYEGLTISISGNNGAEKGLTPAALWWDIDLVVNEYHFNKWAVAVESACALGFSEVTNGVH